MNATVAIVDGNAILSYTFDAGTAQRRIINARVKETWLIPPSAAGFTWRPHTIGLSKKVKAYTDDELAQVLAHELRHCWQFNKWGALDFDAMYLPRAVLFGCGESSKNDIEGGAYKFERESWGDFVEAAKALRAAGFFVTLTPNLQTS